MMICVVIKGPTLQDILEQIEQACTCADLVELRLDLFDTLDFVFLAKLCKDRRLPIMFTLRSVEQGGKSALSKAQRKKTLLELVALTPDYLDLELEDAEEFGKEIATIFPTIKQIISYHHFERVLPNLDALYSQLKQFSAHYYKIAVWIERAVDALQLLIWTKSQRNVITVGMGENGQITRILAPIVGCPWTYAALNEGDEVAPGQLTVDQLQNRYHYKGLSPQTAVYGLIGNPVTHSISDETHNHFFRKQHLDAVYVKCCLTEDELEAFLALSQELPFKGLSVTMPFKETVIPYLNCIESEAQVIGAVNTLRLDQSGWTGCNTDAVGALDAIESHIVVKDKKVLIIGAGGAARAIAYEAKQRGALVTVLNRDYEKARRIAQSLKIYAASLDQIANEAQKGYDILINCTPLLPFSACHLLANSYVMDIKTQPAYSELLLEATQRGCLLIFGYEMFVHQALAQFKCWFNPIEFGVLQTEAMLKNAKSILFSS